MRLFAFDRLDRYTLRLFSGPLLISLVTLLVAQLLERLLRLFDLAASAGASLLSVVVMAANLVPYYLGLSLPMAFTAAIFMASARMCDDHELDVMLASGRSITRVAAPYFILAALLSVFNLYLVAELQPLTRYGYHVAVYNVMQTGWDAKIESNVFVDSGQGFTFSADSVEADGRHVGGVFMERRNATTEEITTATKGVFVPTPDGDGGLLLNLENGVMLREDTRGNHDADGGVSTLRFRTGDANHDFSPIPAPFRERGDGVTEMTLGELRAKAKTGDAPSAAEFHSRIARALILPLLPLLALPLGMASRGGRRAPGVVFATLSLLALNHALAFGSSLASRGHVHAATAVWAPYLIFAVLSLWIFRGSLAWPGDNPVSRVVATIERLFDGVRPRQRAARAAKAAGATS